MSTRSSVSVGQLTALIDFLKDHRELALCRINRTTEGRSRCKRLWEDCALRLNSMSDGTEKSAEQWRTYYNEYKSKLLTKIKKVKSKKSATGGGKTAAICITPLQQRLYKLLGMDVDELLLLPRVRHSPISREREPTIQAARLEQTDNVQADALLKHAAAVRVHGRAINRLAAAMEAIAERLPLPMEMSPPTPPTMFKANLITHLFVHLGQKPYICNICPKTYASQTMLTVNSKQKLRHLKATESDNEQPIK